jgi:hypothetical protein
VLLLLLLEKKKNVSIPALPAATATTAFLGKKGAKTKQTKWELLFYFELDDEKTANHRHPRGIAALMQQDNVARSLCVCVCVR